MGKKLLQIIVAVALLIAGAIIGMRMAGDNRSTVVGDASRYSSAVSGSGLLTDSVGGSGTGAAHEVRDGDSIQAAVAAAQPGDIIRVYPGTYSETVYIDRDDIVISGVVINGQWPTQATTSQSRTCRSSTTKAMPSWARPATIS